MDACWKFINDTKIEVQALFERRRGGRVEEEKDEGRRRWKRGKIKFRLQVIVGNIMLGLLCLLLFLYCV